MLCTFRKRLQVTTGRTKVSRRRRKEPTLSQASEVAPSQYERKNTITIRTTDQILGYVEIRNCCGTIIYEGTMPQQSHCDIG